MINVFKKIRYFFFKFLLSFILSLTVVSIYAEIKTANPHHPEKFINALKQDPQAGKKVYEAFCALCHDPDPQIPIGAPRIGQLEDWKVRQGTLEDMLTRTAEGMNNMPARGGCLECTDEMLKAAIEYMQPKKGKYEYKPG